jgi:hypothetical protein
VVLDTSAFYRLSFEELEGVAERAAVLVSPISLCDILSHLDDPRHRNEAGEPGEVRRSRLCKCDLLQALCNPLVECFPFTGLSESLDTLCGGAGWAAAAERARSALDEARQVHARQVLDFCQDLVAQLGVERALSLSGPDFVRFALASAKELAGPCRELGTEAPALEGAVLSSIYPFAGYRLARAQDRLRRTRGERGPTPDPDDMEDAHLCMHLDLLEPRALVTADAGALSALGRALGELAGASAKVDAEVVALTRAMSPEEVVQAFPRTGRA